MVFFQAEDGIRDIGVTGVQTCALPISGKHAAMLSACVAAGWPTEGYLDREHPLQQAIEARLGEVAGTPVAAVVVEIGRASCRVRVEMSVVAVSLKKYSCFKRCTCCCPS